MRTLNTQANISAMLASTRMRLQFLSRYPGQLVMDLVLPIVLAAMPIFLGRAGGGSNAEAVFEANTGTSNYVAYLLIGSSVLNLVANAFWHMAYWLRREQELGTLETLYQAPTPRIWIAGGTAIYSAVRSVSTAILAYGIGCQIMQVDPFTGEVGLALVFILIGLIPLYSLSLLFGAVILKVKEANALVSLMQWVVIFLMGVYYPITVFPPLVKLLALLFPPTWMTNGVRAALLGVGYFFGTWYKDLAVLWIFMLITPWLGWWVFTRVEKNVRRNEGMGQY
jgi:ABC-2 type transport system permease protein